MKTFLRVTVCGLVVAACLAAGWGKLATVGRKPCPNAASLQPIAHPADAVPAARAATQMQKADVLSAGRGAGSFYADSAARVCGKAVVNASAYIVLHPHGMRCSACNVHVYVVRSGGAYRAWLVE
jgi:hypothetical protein